MALKLRSVLASEKWMAAAVGCLAVVVRIPGISQPLDRDMAAYALIGDRLGPSSLPYAELFDHKQPLIYPVMWVLQIGGTSTEAIRVGAFLIAAATAVLAFLLFRPALGHWRALSGAVMGTVVSASRVVEGTDLNTEHLMALFLVVAVGLPFRYPMRSSQWVGPLVGVCFALALLSKATGIFALPAAALSLFFSGNTFREDARKWLAAVAAGAVPLLLVTLVYATAGHVDDLVYGNWTYNRLYSQERSPSFWGYFVVQERREPILYFFAATVGAGLVLSWFSAKRRRVIGVLLAWAVGMWVAAKYSGRDYGHYFVPVIAPASLLFAGAFPTRRAAAIRVRTVAIVAAAIVFVASLPLLRQVADNGLNETGDSVAFKTYGVQSETWALYEPVGERIAALASPGDEIYVAQLEPGFIWASGLTPASRHIHASAPEQIPEVAAEVDLELCADPPEWFVLFDSTWPTYLPLFEESQYEAVFHEGTVTVTRRRPGSPAMAC